MNYLYTTEANNWMLDRVHEVEACGENRLVLSKDELERYGLYSMSTVFLGLIGGKESDFPEGMVARFGDVFIFLKPEDRPEWGRMIGEKK